MSIFDPILGITRDDGKAKPAIIKFYDHMKGGTDIMDQISERITVKPKSHRWPISGFSWINSGKDGKVKGETFKTLFDFAMKLCEPHLRYRLEHSKGLSTRIRKETAL